MGQAQNSTSTRVPEYDYLENSHFWFQNIEVHLAAGAHVNELNHYDHL